MKQQGSGLWVLGGFLIAAVMGTIAYLFFIAPQFAAGAEALAAAENESNVNDLIEIQILGMEAKRAQEPQWREEMALIALDMPPLPEQPDFHRTVTDTLERYDLPVVRVEYAQPLEVFASIPPPPVPETPPAPPEGEEGEDPEDAEETAAPVEPSPEPSPEPEDPFIERRPTAENTFEGLVGIVVTVESEGSADDLLDFIKDIQTQQDRFFTVTGVKIERAEPTEEEPGRRALTSSDWELELTGVIFVLLDPEKSFVVEPEGENPEFVIGEDPFNAFEPLKGTESDSDV
jgi:hypothetical protein